MEETPQEPHSPFALPLAPGLVLWFALGLALLLQTGSQQVVGQVAQALGSPTLQRAMEPGPVTEGLVAIKLQLGAVQLLSFGLLGAFFMGMGRLWRPQPYAASPALFGQMAVGALLLLCVAPALSLLMLSEETFTLPSHLKELELALEKAETRLGRLFEQLLGQHLALNLLVVAVVPAVCEELFFRGVVQRSLGKLLPGHGAVWLAALLFSLLHFQPYGFVPRLLLGVVLGYLAHYSGRLSPAMVAHFANNAMVVLGGYFVAQGTLDAQLLDPAYQPPLGVVLAGLTLATGLAVVYLRLCRRPAPAEAKAA